MKFHDDNESNISLEADRKEQGFKNDDKHLINCNDELIDLQLYDVTEKENLTKMVDYAGNSYRYRKMKETSLEAENIGSVYCDGGRDINAYDSVSNSNTIISMSDTVSTIKSLRDIDKDLLDEVMREARINDPSSIRIVAEDDIGT